MYLTFTSGDKTVVNGVFGSAPDIASWPNQEELDPASEAWKVYYDALPPLMQKGWPVPTGTTTTS